MKSHLTFFCVTAAISGALACSPYVQPSYISDKTPYETFLSQKSAIKRFLNNLHDLIPAPGSFTTGISTIDAERKDFLAAVRKNFPDMPEEKVVKLTCDFEGLLAKHRRIKSHFPSPETDLPEELMEFQLFLEGRSYLFENRPTDHIPPAWQKLLALPPERRHYRTAWVHFMLGNHFKKDLHTHYDNCRNAVRAGFADTAGLALRSYTLEIRFGTNMARVIRRAAEAELCGSDLEFLGNISLDKINKLDDGQYFALVNDPFCREFLAMIDNSPRFRMMVKSFKLRNADICAYYAYVDGDITEAKEFIAILEKPTLLSTYLEARIARHSGNTPGTVRKLKEWLKLAEKVDPQDRNDLLEISENQHNPPENFRKEIYGLLGTSMIMRRDFSDAAKFFLQAEQRDDLFTIAEKYLTLDELSEMLDEIDADISISADSNPHPYKQPQITRDLRYLAARRAFREKRFDIAGKYMPDEYKIFIRQYLELIKKSADIKLSGNERALAMYNAAKILRHKGMELSGTQNAPDYFPGYYGGDIQGCIDCIYKVEFGEWQLCQNHRPATVPGFNAAKNHLTVGAHMRFHYRYLAAEMALAAGQLADDEELRALIHLFGGSCLKLRSNREADLFYKRLVTMSRNTMLGKLADKQRWFPVVKVLQNEINREFPCESLEAVHELMRSAFPDGK